LSGHGPKESKMRSNAIKTCAVGAMLIGGTLCANSTASAGLTWLGTVTDGDFVGSNSERTLEVGNVVTTTGWGFTAYDNAAFGAATYSNVNAPGASVSFSGLTPSGDNANSWSVSATVSGASAGYVPNATFSTTQFYFSVTGTQQVTLTTAAGLVGGSSWEIFGPSNGWDTALWSFDSTGSTGTANTQTFTLTEPGQYYMSVTMTAGAGYSGDMFNFTVPAPGAAALLGLAGLVGGHRRKA